MVMKLIGHNYFCFVCTHLLHCHVSLCSFKQNVTMFIYKTKAVSEKKVIRNVTKLLSKCIILYATVVFADF